MATFTFQDISFLAPKQKLWTPADISTLLWLDNVDTSTVTLATGISQWNDKSGNGKHISQASGSQQPTIVANSLNGLSGVQFVRGSDQFLANLSTAVSPDKFRVVCVMQKTGSAGGMILKNGSLANDNTAGSALGFGGTTYDDSGNNFIFLHEWVQWCPTTYAISGSTPTIVSALMGSKFHAPSGTNDGPLGVTFNGALPYTFATQNNFPTRAAANSFYVGGGNTRGLDCILYELVAFPWDYPNLDAPIYTEGYLAWKYNLQSNLPSDHAYKSGPPTI